MLVRRAEEKDLFMVNKLLFQVNNVHADGRPDIFIHDKKKYNDIELLELFKDDTKPIFVCVNDDDIVMGYAFCIHETPNDSDNMINHSTLYIDDICVDEDCRRMHVGSTIFDYVMQYAKNSEVDRITLNVWSLNESAAKFYENCGMKPLKVMMETTLY